MAATTDYTNTPGFQGSQTTGAEVVIYPQGGDPVVFAGSTVEFSGKSISDPKSSLMSVQTSKPMGGAGQFSFVVKPSAKDKELLEQCIDDDWVDIFLTQHGKSWHVMRGLLEGRRRMKAVANRATSTTYTFTGQDFQKIWEITPIWFDRFSTENLGGAAILRVSEVPIGLPPDAVVKAFLEGFLKELGSLGRANWKIPDAMPGCGGLGFIAAVKQRSTDFMNVPKRIAVAPNFAGASGNLWALAREWSDPMFHELYTDTEPVSGQKTGNMVVVFRTKPFAVTVGAFEGVAGKESPWFALPQIVVPRQQIVSHDIGSSGAERFNAFFVGGQIQQQFVRMAGDIARPLWNLDDMLLHGMRRLDFESHYMAEDSDMVGMSTLQRQQICDWYCMNPYFLSGQIGLGIGRPDAHIGTRLLIPDGSDPKKDEQYYIESVSHVWNLRQGQKTSLAVTRGWIGTDDKLLNDLAHIKQGYSVPPLGKEGP